MSDDVDDLVRRALGTLEAPDGYFEGLADRVTARLDDALPALAAADAADDGARATEARADAADDGARATGARAEDAADDGARATGARDEDSGLQDIRSLASEAKARLRRSSQAVPGPASSAAWRAVAVADPRRAAQAGISHDPPVAVALTDEPPVDEVAAARALRVAPPTATPAVPVRKPRSLFAAAGLAVAMAAGALIFVTTRGQDTSALRVEVARRDEVAAPDPVGFAVKPPTTLAPAEGSAGSADRRAAEAPSPVAADAPPKPPSPVVADAPPRKTSKRAEPVATKPGPTGKRKGDVVAQLPEPGDAERAPAKPEPPPAKQAPAEPSLDELLKDDKPAPAAPRKLARQGLSTDDAHRGLAPTTAAAKRCYNGTTGTATVRLTVAPSGQITKVTVTGPFAGTPVAACVERAVRTAAFPPWDGGPQTLATSYLLAE